MRCPQWATGNRSTATNITTEKFTEETPTPNGLKMTKAVVQLRAQLVSAHLKYTHTQELGS
jgi:hypothetical protein